ncbi:hypothetical protein HPO96_31795 [Kribbella sandramycini]|uniref:Uncharacterized protein n=1 Tax=Kribbella sandramycini TaxID=60450 RepID=A0A7Y4L5M8_9ACTN|nr:hypothetical protein [Kribbella sandramycini]MBB6567127.1 hypothetical protein [Kribbella sandramycini]NOL44844.1 hypothetical protein [Kribbella sandramycini]
MSYLNQPPAGCGCGREVRQPWRSRDSAYSPASFIGGLIWLALGVGSLIGGWTIFGLAVLGVLAALVLGALIVQGRRGHRGGCLVGRAFWFGIAVPGLPLRVAYWFNF